MRNKETAIRLTLTLRQRSGLRRGNKELSLVRKTAGIICRSKATLGRLLKKETARESRISRRYAQLPRGLSKDSGKTSLSSHRCRYRECGRVTHHDVAQQFA